MAPNLKKKYSILDLEQAVEFYKINGFVVFEGLLDTSHFSELKLNYKKSVEEKDIKLSNNKFLSNDDFIFLNDCFFETAFNENIVNVVSKIFGSKVGIELQHCKINDKPQCKVSGKVPWHQDFPYFPHTNLDLLAATIHLDPETQDSGCLKVLPGSHKRGILEHVQNGKFIGEYIYGSSINPSEVFSLTTQPGDVHFHHCLLLHKSDPNYGTLRRRHLTYQYRAEDAIQLAGPLWKSTGLSIRSGDQKGMARFFDERSIEVRGVSGRLYDPFSTLAPDGHSLKFE